MNGTAMKIGYARVSKTDQNLELQTDALHAAGVEKIYQDRLSGTKEDRDGLTDNQTQDATKSLSGAEAALSALL